MTDGSEGSSDARRRVSNGAVVDRGLMDQVATELSALTGAAAQVEPLASGVSSANLYCRSGGHEFVARIELFRSLADLECDFAYAESAARHGVNAIPLPVWIGHVGRAPVSIRPWITGAQADVAEMTPALAYLAGRQLAFVHGARVPTGRAWFYEEPLADPTGLRLPDRPLVETALRNCVALPREGVMVHTDYRASNWVVSESGLHVLDWEKAAPGPRLFDLGLAAFHFAAWPGPAWRDLVQRFLDGYTSVYGAQRFGEVVDAIRTAGSVFYLVDAEIFGRTRDAEVASPIDRRHAEYFLRYCEPAMNCLVERLPALTRRA
ncbi:aminoglycoside phosphotransferase family protein [Propionicicella superfundia]|uniref:aminoglycoside phosphotransferase family protein n=1 Tax=Propionicicella superfundia TaxID=348582 RepID=UPI00040A3F33|nr:aminoglycoside phosphotransferase family protein [Propionicicella superfundia]